MPNKMMTSNPGVNKDFFSKLNLFVQTHTALMALIIAAILFLVTIIINPKGLNTVAIGNIILLTIILSIFVNIKAHMFYNCGNECRSLNIVPQETSKVNEAEMIIIYYN